MSDIGIAENENKMRPESLFGEIFPLLFPRLYLPKRTIFTAFCTRRGQDEFSFFQCKKESDERRLSFV